MIAETLNFLRRHLDERLRVELGGSQDDATGDRVVFLDGDKIDPIHFQLNAVTSLLINVEEERVIRPPDLYARQAADGTRQRVQPEVRLILYVLFVSRFKKYDVGWQHLSKILEHLQANRVFDGASAPDLPAGIDRLVVELVTLDFAGQNEVWNALRTTHHPSLLYRVKLLAYRDRRPGESPEIAEQQRDIGGRA